MSAKRGYTILDVQSSKYGPESLLYLKCGECEDSDPIVSALAIGHHVVHLNAQYIDTHR